VGVGEQEGGDRSDHHHRRIDDPPAVLVGPDAQHQADQAAREDRHADQEAELRVAQAKVRLDLHADDRKDRTDGEVLC
jgi:hypothetical protein